MSRRLSNRIEAIEYVHADDGLPYRHRFKSGGRIALLKDGSVKISNPDKKLWQMFDMGGTDQPFLVNPPRGGTMRKMSAKQRKYFGKRKNPARKSVVVVHRARSVARRRNPTNPPRHKKRRRRRNPPVISVQGLLKRAQQGALDALAVVGGRIGVRAISKQFPYPAGSVMDTVMEVGGALALGMVAERILGPDRGRFVLAGALSSSVEDVIASANIPYVSSLLSGLPNANTAAVYASADAGRSLGAWQQQGAMGSWQGGRAPLGRMGAVDALPGLSVAVFPPS